MRGALQVVHGAGARSRRARSRLWLVTRGAQAAQPQEAREPGAGDAVGPEPRGRDRASGAALPARRPDAIRRAGDRPRPHCSPSCDSASREDQIALRGDARLARRLARITRASAARGRRSARIDPASHLPRDRWPARPRPARGRVARRPGRATPRADGPAGARSRRRGGARPPAQPRRADRAWPPATWPSRRTCSGARATCEPALPPLAGVIHAAGALDDGVLSAQTLGALRHRDGGEGARQLEPAPTCRRSSISSCCSRRARRSPGRRVRPTTPPPMRSRTRSRGIARRSGQPTVSINWGPWAEIGAAADRRIKTAGFLRRDRAARRPGGARVRDAARPPTRPVRPAAGGACWRPTGRTCTAQQQTDACRRSSASSLPSRTRQRPRPSRCATSGTRRGTVTARASAATAPNRRRRSCATTSASSPRRSWASRGATT